MTSEDARDQDEAIRKLESLLKLSPGFFRSLLNQDDWSFVIKTHTLIEAAVSHILVMHLGRPELLEIFMRLELSDISTGKVAFAKALGCIDEDHRRMLRALSELRNKLTHRIENASLTLAAYVAGLDTNQFGQFRKAFAPGEDPYVIGERTIPAAQWVRDNPKLTIWFSVLFFLHIAYSRSELAEQTRQFQRDIYEAVGAAARQYAESRPASTDAEQVTERASTDAEPE